MSDHGTISRYTNDRCRCPLCSDARKAYWYWKQCYGPTRVRVSASRARRHVRYLLLNGWTSPTLASRANVSADQVRLTANGASRQIEKGAEERLLAVGIEDAPYRDRPYPNSPRPSWMYGMPDYELRAIASAPPG